MLPVIIDRIGWLKFLKVPVDFGHKLGQETIFGENKTYRGIIVGTIGGILTAYLQSLIYQYHPSTHALFLFPYTGLGWLYWGFLLGFGALLGDLVKSFFKRRLHLKNGKPFFPFDQLDFVIGGLLLGAIFYLPPWPQIIVLIVFTPLLHFLANALAYLLKLKKVWW